MSEMMQSTETGVPDGVEIAQTTVLKNKMDPGRMSVRFIVCADSPAKAFAFATDPALIAEGERIVREERLPSPAVTGSAIPISCNEKGEAVGNPMGEIDPNVKRKYYYSITYEYLGED